MDAPSSPIAPSEGSFYDDSTRPTTPASSPLFGASKVDELIPSMPKPDTDKRVSTGHAPIKNICVIGAGYVGGPTAAVLALHNPSITVEVLDRDPRRIEKWKSRHPPVHEPDLNNVVRVTRDGAETTTTTHGKRHPNLFFTCDSATSIRRADMIFLAVNTPTKTFGVGAGRATDMTAVDGAVRDIAHHAKPGAIVVEKSTVPCGTAQRIRQMVTTLRPGLPIEVLSNPEFLAEGSAVENLCMPDRVLIGSSETLAGRMAARQLAQIYAAWVPSTRIIEINAWSSELAKLVANAMLAQRISSINAISAICERTGAEVDQVARAVGMDVRIGPQFLKAGVGFGGSCFRKDIASLTYLAESLGLEDVAHYWRQVNVMNENQRGRFARRVIAKFDGNLHGRKIAVLGFAFKKDTGDTRESPTVDVIRLLLEERPHEIAIFDPYCQEEDIYREIEPVCGSGSVKVLGDPYLACSQAHAVLVMTDCDQFRHAPVKCGRLAAPVTHVSRMEDGYDSLAEVIMTPAKQEEEVWTSHGVSYRLASQAVCPTDCMTCRSTTSRPAASEPVEWARVAYNLKEPKWVLDGRGFLDVAEMERLGLQIDTVGRRPVHSAGSVDVDCE
ncbi:hypothetical protein FE257_010220 [Aspergillus nanangensis]|uniref:UDP-glucose 6-dehydrogenase n=1 Tax=Aspergillus nanangensis TaxID=2582783 RepID=A0AAD4GS98_ASPNN|nr:hypothetical protein FE257_010220 [Aspergillus nanangensis]